MSGFSPDWLALREPVDHRSRNPQLVRALQARFEGRSTVTVVDLGCGTGSNLRAVAPLLGPEQSWTLVDNDPELLVAARDTLRRWADEATADGDTLRLTRDGRQIAVGFRQANLAQDLEAALGEPADLITASALFDLASPEFIRQVAVAVAARRAAFYTVLTYNGIQRWTPRHPADNAMTAAFHQHQMRDKGFGPSAGPTAPAHLADRFRLGGYGVLEGESPWVLGPGDARLIGELQRGFVEAVRETRALDDKTLDAWAKAPRTGCEVGHTDTLAVPA